MHAIHKYSISMRSLIGGEILHYIWFYLFWKYNFPVEILTLMCGNKDISPGDLTNSDLGPTFEVRILPGAAYWRG